MLYLLLKTILLPPASLFLLALLGALMLSRRPRFGRILIGVAVIVSYLISTPLVARLLVRSLELDPPMPPGKTADAIVVLSGDSSFSPEYGSPTVGDQTLERIRYAAWIHRRTGAPILVTGGVWREDRESVGALMKKVLEEEFGVPVRWSETASRNTFENAAESAKILDREGIRTVLVVTHAWHMYRARRCFEAVGFEVIPAPTAFQDAPDADPREVLPSAHALRDSTNAFHEWIGLIWYRLRYF